MKKYILLFLSFFLSLTISACAAQDSPVPAPAETARTESGENVREKGEALMRIQITANGRTWQAETGRQPRCAGACRENAADPFHARSLRQGTLPRNEANEKAGLI